MILLSMIFLPLGMLQQQDVLDDTVLQFTDLVYFKLADGEYFNVVEG